MNAIAYVSKIKSSILKISESLHTIIFWHGHSLSSLYFATASLSLGDTVESVLANGLEDLDIDDLNIENIEVEHGVQVKEWRLMKDDIY